MKLLKYTHANLNTEVVVDMDKVFSFYYSQGHKATLLLATGGAMIPVSEPVEKITEDMKTEEKE